MEANLAPCARLIISSPGSTTTVSTEKEKFSRILEVPDSEISFSPQEKRINEKNEYG
jgi:hypothetical protein